MNARFKKLAIASAVTAGLAGASLPANAIIEGSAGEALLIPLVVYSSTNTGGYNVPVNTLIEVVIPGSMGFETIPNDFTAQNTAPTNPGATVGPNDADLEPNGNFIHWYWFDKYSDHQLNGRIPVTADDMVLINWGDVVGAGGEFDGEAGYMVIGNENARYRVEGGDPANPALLSTPDAQFAMFGDAYLVADVTPGFDVDAKIPVLPMSDGYDGPLGTPVTPRDSVKYGTTGVPIEVSPLIAGMRTNRSDGSLTDTTLFDLTLSDRQFPTLHVVWLDVNLEWVEVCSESSNFGCEVRQIDVFDDEEYTCSTSVDLPYELNTVWIPAWNDPTQPVQPDWVDLTDQLCLPFGNAAAATSPGFARYTLPEYIDNDVDAPESAGVTFAIKYGFNGTQTPNIVPIDTALGHERGMFK